MKCKEPGCWVTARPPAYHDAQHVQEHASTQNTAALDACLDPSDSQDCTCTIGV